MKKIILIGLVMILSVSFYACNSSNKESSPSEIVKLFVNYSNEGKYTDLEKIIRSEELNLIASLGGIKSLGDSISKNGTVEEVEILNEEIKGEGATVIYRIQYEDDSIDYKVEELILDNDEWLLTTNSNVNSHAVIHEYFIKENPLEVNEDEIKNQIIKNGFSVKINDNHINIIDKEIIFNSLSVEEEPTDNNMYKKYGVYIDVDFTIEKAEIEEDDFLGFLLNKNDAGDYNAKGYVEITYVFSGEGLENYEEYEWKLLGVNSKDIIADKK